MDKILTPFKRAYERQEGYPLAEVLSPVPPENDPDRLQAIRRSTDVFAVQADLTAGMRKVQLSKPEREVWVNIFVSYWKGIDALLAAQETAQDGKPDWTRVYTAWKDLLNQIHSAYSKQALEPWTIPILYMVTKHLRTFAIQADAYASPTSFASDLDEFPADDSASNPNLEDCARQINRIFALVTQDRAPMPNRKYGTYYITTLLFRTYFRLNGFELCKPLIKSISAANATDMPELKYFPKAHRVGYLYYVGVVAFLDERYADALKALEEAWQLCLAGPGGRSQASRILEYLVPAQLLVRHWLPSAALLADYPELEAVYAPLCAAVRKGDVGAFDAALAAGEDRFVKKRVYLTLERGRDVCLRNLFRRVYLAGGYDEQPDAAGNKVRRSRFKIEEFAAAMRVMGQTDISSEEVEALLAGLLYKDMMKGYISRAHSTVVVKKGAAFPGTGV